MIAAGTASCAIGAAILYGKPTDATHIGIVVRLEPMILTTEGNRSLAGAVTNNGIGVDIGPQNRKDVIGYVWPEA